jgi:hypothetical protein
VSLLRAIHFCRRHTGSIKAVVDHPRRPPVLVGCLSMDSELTEIRVHTFASFTQSSIDGSTSRAPDGEHDDRADAFALACAGRPTAGCGWVLHEHDPKSLSVLHLDNVPKGVFLDEADRPW